MGYKIGQWVAKNYPNANPQRFRASSGQGPAEGEMVGYQLALDEANMRKAIVLKSADWQRTKAIPVTEDLLASGKQFDVIFAANEEEAAGVIQVFKEQGDQRKNHRFQQRQGRCLEVDEGGPHGRHSPESAFP